MPEYTSKAKELNEILEKMYVVSTEVDYGILCGMFDGIYLDTSGDIDDGFRHEYSSISGKIKELNSESMGGEAIFSLDNLLENISNVYDYAVSQQKPYIKSLFKLKDHIGLEAGRINSIEQLKWQITNGEQSVKAQLNYMEQLAFDIGNQLQQSRGALGQIELSQENNEKNIEQASNTLEALKISAEEVSEKIETIHADSITILGIFASIVLSFTAGIVFTSSVLQSIDKASPFRLVGVTIIIGFVIINIITILLAYINKIKTVKYTKIQYPTCVKILNAVLAFTAVSDFVLWLLICKPYGIIQ